MLIHLSSNAPAAADPFQRLREALAAVEAPIGNMVDRHERVQRVLRAQQLYREATDPHTIRALLAAVTAGALDKELLDFLRAESLDLRCFAMPTGAGDADIGWKVIQHHEASPHEREVGVWSTAMTRERQCAPP